MSSELHLATDMGPEEFQNKLFKWFEQRGILTDLRAHLRCQMSDALKTVPLGNKVPPQEKLRQSMSPKLQALNLLIAEYLVQKKYNYTLSVFSSEVPIVTSFPDFTKAVIDIASTTNSGNFQRESAFRRFDSSDVWDILEAMGLPSDSEQANMLHGIYSTNPLNDSLLVCMIRLMPLAFREYYSKKSQRNGEEKRHEGNISHKGKSSNSKLISSDLENEQSERKKKWITETLTQVEKDTSVNKASVEPANNLSFGNIEEKIITELQIRMQEVYDYELQSAKKAEENKYNRALNNRERELAEEYNKKISQFEEDKAKFEEEMKQKRSTLESEIDSKKKYLCNLAKHLNEHKNIVARTLESVQQQAEMTQQKELDLDKKLADLEANKNSRSGELHIQVQNELKAVELQKEEMLSEERKLNQERSLVEAMKKDLEGTKKNIEEMIKGLALAEVKNKDEKTVSIATIDRITQTENPANHTQIVNEIDENQKITQRRTNSVEKQCQTNENAEISMNRYPESQILNADDENGKRPFVMNEVRIQTVSVENVAVGHTELTNVTFPKKANITMDVHNAVGMESERKNENITFDNIPEVPMMNIPQIVDKTIGLQNRDAGKQEVNSYVQNLLKKMLKRIQNENAALKNIIQEQRSQIGSMTSRQTGLQEDLSRAQSTIEALSVHLAGTIPTGNMVANAPPTSAPVLADAGRNRGIATNTGILSGNQLGSGDKWSNFDSDHQRPLPRPVNITRHSLGEIREARRNAGRNRATVHTSAQSRSHPRFIPEIQTARHPWNPNSEVHQLSPPTSLPDTSQIPERNPSVTDARMSYFFDDSALDLVLSDEIRQSDTDNEPAIITDEVLTEARRRLRRLELEMEAVDRSYQEFRTRHNRDDDFYPRSDIPSSSSFDPSSLIELPTKEYTRDVLESAALTVSPNDPLKRLKQRSSIFQNRTLANYYAVRRSALPLPIIPKVSSCSAVESFAGRGVRMMKYGAIAPKVEKTQLCALLDSPMVEFRRRYDKTAAEPETKTDSNQTNLKNKYQNQPEKPKDEGDSDEIPEFVDVEQLIVDKSSTRFETKKDEDVIQDEEIKQIEEVKPFEDVKPIEKETKPIEEEIKPIEEEIKPIEDIKPIEKEIKPVEEEIRPIEEEIKPIEEEIKAIEKKIKPTEEEMKLIGEEIKPVEAEIKQIKDMQPPIKKDIEPTEDATQDKFPKAESENLETDEKLKFNPRSHNTELGPEETSDENDYREDFQDESDGTDISKPDSARDDSFFN